MIFRMFESGRQLKRTSMANNRILLTAAFILTLFLSSCGADKKTGRAGETSASADSTAVLEPFYYDTLKGIYYGDFGGTELRIVINYVSEGHAVGYSIVKGLQRNISGKVTATATTIDMELAEPGDNKYDGVFKLSADRQTFGISGSWKPNDPKLAVKTFKLAKMELPGEGEAITPANFASFFAYAADSLGEFNFDQSGLCTYVYYPSKNDDYRDQKEEFTGSWRLNGDQLTIDWQENPVFPSRTSTFRIVTQPEYTQYLLEGEGRSIYSYYGVG